MHLYIVLILIFINKYIFIYVCTYAYLCTYEFTYVQILKNKMLDKKLHLRIKINKGKNNLQTNS